MISQNYLQQNVVFLRHFFCLSQKEFIDLLDNQIDIRTISRIEQGFNVSEYTKGIIASFFNISIEDLELTDIPKDAVKTTNMLRTWMIQKGKSHVDTTKRYYFMELIPNDKKWYVISFLGLNCPLGNELHSIKLSEIPYLNTTSNYDEYIIITEKKDYQRLEKLIQVKVAIPVSDPILNSSAFLRWWKEDYPEFAG